MIKKIHSGVRTYEHRTECTSSLLRSKYVRVHTRLIVFPGASKKKKHAIIKLGILYSIQALKKWFDIKKQKKHTHLKQYALLYVCVYAVALRCFALPGASTKKKNAIIRHTSPQDTTRFDQKKKKSTAACTTHIRYVRSVCGCFALLYLEPVGGAVADGRGNDDDRQHVLHWCMSA